MIYYTYADAVGLVGGGRSRGIRRAGGVSTPGGAVRSCDRGFHGPQGPTAIYDSVGSWGHPPVIPWPRPPSRWASERPSDPRALRARARSRPRARAPAGGCTRFAGAWSVRPSCRVPASPPPMMASEGRRRGFMFPAPRRTPAGAHARPPSLMWRARARGPIGRPGSLSPLPPRRYGWRPRHYGWRLRLGPAGWPPAPGPRRGRSRHTSHGHSWTPSRPPPSPPLPAATSVRTAKRRGGCAARRSGRGGRAARPC